MAEIAKYAPINGGTLISDFKTHFSIHRRTKRTVTVAYVFVFFFIVFTIFIAFIPPNSSSSSTNTSSPWFTNIFSGSNYNNNNPNSTTSTTIFSDQSYRSHFSSILYYFFPNSTTTTNNNNNQTPPPQNALLFFNPSSSSPSTTVNNNNNNITIQNPPLPDDLHDQNQNQTSSTKNVDKVELLKKNNPPPTVNNNNTIQTPPLPVLNNHNNNNLTQPIDKNQVLTTQNQTTTTQNVVKDEVLKPNQSTIGYTNTSPKQQQNNKTTGNTKPVTDGGGDKGLVVKNLTSSLEIKQKQGIINDQVIKSLMNCDLFDGNWITDDTYPLYKPGSCSLIDEQFNCFLNGRPDNAYYKLKWKPKACSLPRLNGSHMLEMLRGKRLVFVGDSLNRNMWESLICILKNSVKDQKKVYEEFGRHHFRAEASYSFVFEEYKCTVEFFVAPFLVQEWEAAGKDGKKKETLRLDIIGESAEKYKNADVIVFNTGHWWTHEKTSTGKDYYQEGSHIYSELNVLEAFRKALTTWARWVDKNVNPMKSLVFFRGYSASHFSGGQWNSGGQCDHETEPIKNDTYLTPYPPKMAVLEKVLRGMKNRATYLNVTRLTDYRKDGHPSIYRKQHYSDEEKKSPLHFQDCSHWCLPGVPDSWNEILYAELLVKLNQRRP